MLPGKTYSIEDIRNLAKRRLWLLPLPAATLFAALVYSSYLPDVYHSEMTIAIVPQRVPDEFVRSTVTLRTEERLDAITVQIKSRTVLEPMIKEFELYQEEQKRLPMEDVVQRMRDDIKVELEAARRQNAQREMEPTAFHVGFTYPDANVAARVTQRLGSTYVDQNSRDRGALAEATDEFLNTQLKEARDRLEAQEKLVEAFREKHGNELPTQLTSNLAAIQNAQLQVQALVEALARDRDRKLMLERLYQEAQNETVATPQAPVAVVPAPGVTGGPPASAKQQLAAARTLLASLEMRLTPEHPDILRTKRLIAELEPKAATESTAEKTVDNEPTVSPDEALRRERLRTMRAEIESLDRQTQFKESEERRLRTQVAEYQRRIEAVPSVESQWTVLTRDYDTQNAAYQDLLKKSAASKVAVDLESRQIGENFRVLDPARVPMTPISPKRGQISIIGFVIGIALVVAIAGLLELKDASFRTEAEVVGLLGMNVLAAVPYVVTESERTRRRWLGLAIAAVAVVITTGAAYVFWVMRLWTVIV